MSHVVDEGSLLDPGFMRAVFEDAPLHREGVTFVQLGFIQV